MTNNILLRTERPLGPVTKKPWVNLLENDVVGIDGYIEKLIDIYRARYGYTRGRANAALVRRLSRLTGPGTV
jgi:hypothetical protein